MVRPCGLETTGANSSISPILHIFSTGNEHSMYHASRHIRDRHRHNTQLSNVVVQVEIAAGQSIVRLGKWSE